MVETEEKNTKIWQWEPMESIAYDSRSAKDCARIGAIAGLWS